jgi:hypothetical protein
LGSIGIEDIVGVGSGTGGSGLGAGASGGGGGGLPPWTVPREVLGVQPTEKRRKLSRKMVDFNMRLVFGILNIIKNTQIRSLIVMISGSSSGVEH